MMSVPQGFKVQALLDAGRIRPEEVAAVREKLGGAVPPMSDEQISHFIISCDNDLDFATATIVQYYKAKKSGSELFNNRILEGAVLDYMTNFLNLAIMPKRTPEGHAVICHKLANPSYYNFNHVIDTKLFFMAIEAAIYDNPPAGLIIIYDCKGLSLLHTTRYRYSTLRKYCHYMLEGIPVKFYEMHLVNAVYFTDKLINLIKPLSKPGCFDKLHVHYNRNELKTASIPNDCLPAEYGGSLPPLQELHEATARRLQELRPYFEAEEHQREVRRE